MTSSLLPGPLAREHSIAPAAPRTGEPRSSDSDDAYLLRLCLDLKLDVLLLTLGAAAIDPACTWRLAAPGEPEPQAPDAEPSSGVLTEPAITEPAIADPPIDLTSLALTTGEDHPPDLPWERWLREDVDAVHALARELLAGGGRLPWSMSGTGTSSSTLAALERLEAFHAQLLELLVEVEVLRDNGALPAVPPGVTSASPTQATQEQAVARHCRRRLAELQQHRIELAELLAARTAALGAGGHPGEFLG